MREWHKRMIQSHAPYIKTLKIKLGACLKWTKESSGSVRIHKFKDTEGIICFFCIKMKKEMC